MTAIVGFPAPSSTAFELIKKGGEMSRLWLVPVVVVVAAACGLSGGGGGSLDPGPPTRPLFKEVEGLKWGMTPAEVRAAWGPGEEGKAYSYPKKGGYLFVSLGYMSIPGGDVIHTDLARDPKDTGPVEFLVSASFQGNSTFQKDTVRADLASRFGQPLTDAQLLRANDCRAGRCELFRAAECTLVKASWNPADAELKWPEHLDSLVYVLAPDHLVQYLPRTEWSKLRGSVPLSFTPEVREKFDKLGSVGGSNAPTLAEMTKAVGSPNLYLETAPGKGTLYYLFLDGSLLAVSVQEGRYRGSMGSTVN
jgi:hypothetical protein